MKILVIGGSGFIGRHLAKELASQGHHLRGLDLKSPHDSGPFSDFTVGDVRRSEDVRKALADSACVINLAAVHADFGHADQEYWDTNEGGCRVVLDELRQAGALKHVFVSSMAVYGDRDDEPDEQTNPSPSSPYGASKLAAEALIRQWCSEDDRRSAVVIRPCVVYGEHNVANMYNLIRQIHSGWFLLFGSGENVKATAYVGNLVHAIVWLVESMRPGLTLYNYADKPDLTVRQITQTIRRSLGKTPDATRLPLWMGIAASTPLDMLAAATGRDFPISSARIKKLARPTQMSAAAIREAGFEQQFESEEGLRRMVDHFLAERKV